MTEWRASRQGNGCFAPILDYMRDVRLGKVKHRHTRVNPDSGEQEVIMMSIIPNDDLDAMILEAHRKALKH